MCVHACHGETWPVFQSLVFNEFKVQESPSTFFSCFYSRTERLKASSNCNNFFFWRTAGIRHWLFFQTRQWRISFELFFFITLKVVRTRFLSLSPPTCLTLSSIEYRCYFDIPTHPLFFIGNINYACDNHLLVAYVIFDRQMKRKAQSTWFVFVVFFFVFAYPSELKLYEISFPLSLSSSPQFLVEINQFIHAFTHLFNFLRWRKNPKKKEKKRETGEFSFW